jgi:hypothetical protein
MMMFLSTFAWDAGGPPDLERLGAALQTARVWSVLNPNTGEAFWFATMEFSSELSARLKNKECRSGEVADDFTRSSCQEATVGGESGRDYVSRTTFPSGPVAQSYLVQRIIVRDNRLYLLAYSNGQKTAARSGSRFLNSLRFEGP